MKAKKIAVKKAGRKRKVVARKRPSSKSKKLVSTPNSDYLNAIAYLVSSEEKEVNLMVASTMGLVDGN